MNKKLSLYIVAILDCLSTSLILLQPLFLFSSIACTLALLILAIIHCRNSQTDTLTGLYNPQRLNDMRSLYRNCPTVTVAYIDLNDLKNINDTYGHAEGNKTLIQLSHYLKSITTRFDDLYRIGGDEFLLVSRKSDIATLTKKLLTPPDAIKISFGIATGSGNALKDLIRAAEANMYQMKTNR